MNITSHHNQVAHPITARRILLDAVGVLLFVAAVAGMSYRLSQKMVIDGQAVESEAVGRNGLADFRDVVYYPVRAVKDGVNPYDCRKEPKEDGSERYWSRYPILHPIPLYSPLVFALFAPFSLGSLAGASVAWVVFNLALLLGFAYLIWRVAGTRPTIFQLTVLATVMLLSQPGRANYIGGDTALPLAIVTVLAVALADKHPWLAAIALAVTSFKPTFGLPLGILLLCGGHYRTVLAGWGAGAIAGFAGLAIIFSNSGDLDEFLPILRHNQEVLQSDPDGNALVSAIRIDSAGALQRILSLEGEFASLSAILLVLSVSCYTLYRLRSIRNRLEARPLEIAVISSATIATLFHITYDGLLIWAAIACIALTPAHIWQGTSRFWRWTVAGLLVIPMINILGTRTFQDIQTRLLGDLPSSVEHASWTLVCSLNGLALLAAIVAILVQVHSLARQKINRRPADQPL